MKGIILISFLFLLTLALTIVSIYTTYQSSTLSLPIVPFAQALSLLLPLLNFAVILFYRRLSTSRRGTLLSYIPPSFILSLLGLFDAVLVSLSASDLRPQLRACLLHDTWMAAFRRKDVGVIRHVQDALGCCGYASTVDMPWPFPRGGGAGRESCRVEYEREASCAGLLAERDRTVLVGMVVVGIFGMVVKVLFLFLERQYPEWIWQGERGGWTGVSGRITEEGDVDAENQRESRYLDAPNGRYTDNPQEHTEDSVNRQTQ